MLFIYRMVKYKPPTVDNGDPYPEFGQGIGWALTAFVLAPIPLTFLYKLIRAEGNLFTRLKTITTPDADWKPNDGSGAHPLNSYKMEEKFGIDNPIRL